MGTRLLFADLIVILMVAFDVILGMDWLSTYRAVIDCVGKTVKFLVDDHESEVFVGLGSSLIIPIISYLQATKLLHKGCIGFLASVLDVRKESNMQLQDIDVVQDYPDVFAEEMSGLPPAREVEFVIELISGTAPISKAPYRMAPTEMRELKNQLQELLDKGTVARLSALVFRSTLFDRILKEHQFDNQLLELKRKSDLSGVSKFGLNRDGLFTFRGRICVPLGDDIRKDVIIEAHTAPYSDEVGERKMLGPELVQQTADVVALIQEKMKTAQSRHKSYADVRRRPLAIEIGDRAYRLALPADLDRVHNVFHVFMLRKYLPNPSHVLRHESLDILPNLSYEEVPVQIFDRKVKVLRNKEIGLVKVLWRNHVIEEATWESEEEMKQHYPVLFDVTFDFILNDGFGNGNIKAMSQETQKLRDDLIAANARSDVLTLEFQEVEEGERVVDDMNVFFGRASTSTGRCHVSKSTYADTLSAIRHSIPPRQLFPQRPLHSVRITHRRLHCRNIT
ncbi:uncharacterized protein LOC142505157 [Primulina tabacum]|uniref:uncharacterized protein LOC142505157 n=1 Tax=Primulina tabacum TaxID=48773 RepID=UPI003F5A9577